MVSILKFFGLAEADLSRQLTFRAGEGQPTSSQPSNIFPAVLVLCSLASHWLYATGGMRVKKPFPTPCSLGDALFLYCDLARAPSKKMQHGPNIVTSSKCSEHRRAPRLSAMQEHLTGEAQECVGVEMP